MTRKIDALRVAVGDCFDLARVIDEARIAVTRVSHYKTSSGKLINYFSNFGSPILNHRSRKGLSLYTAARYWKYRGLVYSASL